MANEVKVVIRADTAGTVPAVREVGAELGKTAQAAQAAGAASVQTSAGLKQVGQSSATAAASQSDFVARLRDQVATVNKSADDLLRYRAAQAGVAAEAAPLILQLQNMKAAMAAKAQADAEAARTAAEQAAGVRAQEAAQRSFVASLKEQVATQGMNPEALLKYRAAQLGVSHEADGLIAKLAQQGHAGQVSAAQTANAMRQLPAQFSDIAVSLQGGQSPLSVLLQQGSQIKDSFGGTGAAVRALGGYVLGLIGPVTLLAAAGTALTVAYFQGAAEALEYERALILTGNAAGVTSGRLADTAKRIDTVVGTQAKAADTLAQFAGAANISPAGLEQFATVAIKMERTVGTSVAETVKQFSALGAAPLAESIKLNSQINFLTVSTYQQIKALQESGQAAAAAALAQKAYAEAMDARTAEIDAHLGTLARGWLGVKDLASEAWDAMLGIGRADTLGDKIAAAQKRVDDLQQHLAKGGRKGWFGESIDDGSADELVAAQADLAGLKGAKTGEDTEAQLKGEAAALVKATAAWDESGKQYLSARKKLDRDIAAIQNEGKAAGASQAQIDARVAAASFAYNLAVSDANASLTLARGKAAADAEFRQLDASQAALDARRNLGLVSERVAAEQSLQIELDRLTRQRSLIDQQIATEKARPVKPDDEAAGTAKQAKLVDLDAQRRAITDKLAQAPVLTGAKLDGIDLSAARADAAAYAQLWQSSADLAQQLAEQTTQGLTALITDPLARARAEASLSADAIVRNAEKIGLSLRNQIEVLRGRGQKGQADELQKQLDQIQAGAKTAAQGVRGKPDQEFLQGYLKTDINTDFSAGFDRSSQALGTFVQGFAGLMKMQENYDKARLAAGDNAEKLAAVEAVYARQQLNTYGSLAGALKGFTREGSKDYQHLQAVEQAFRAAEMAGAIRTAAIKIGLIEGETAAKVTGDGVKAGAETGFTLFALAQSGIRTAASAVEAAVSSMAGLPFPLNLAALGATTAAIAALGVSIFGGGGGGSITPTNQGTGTVLGDKSAKSESLSKSLEALKEVDTLTMRYSGLMLESLRNIESNIGGLAGLLVRSGAVDSAAVGVVTGFDRNLGGSAIKAVSDVLTLGLLPGLGNALGNLFGTKTEVTASGIAGGAQTLGSIAENGFQAQTFADVKTTKKTFGIKTGGGNSTRFADADAETERQFGLVLTGFADAMRAAAGPLGVSLSDVESRLSGFVVDLGRIDLKGLTGEQISEKLSAVFGAAGDRIATAALGGLEDFTKVGEGYLETVVRVASGTEVAQAALKRLGVGAVSLANLTNKQGDVAAETVRQSLVAAETTYDKARAAAAAQAARARSGGGFSGALAAGLASARVMLETSQTSAIGKIIEALSGSADELADTYRALTDVRLSLQLLGLKGDAVTSSLLQGAGGLQALTDGLAKYEENFFSAAEKSQAQAGRLTREFSKLGLTLPKNAAEFRRLVQGIDTSTDAGQELLGGVLNLSGGFADLLDAISATGSGIADEIERIKGLSATSSDRSLTELRADFAIKSAQARAGDQGAIDALPKASQALLAAAEEQANSAVELKRIQAATLASLEETLARVSTTDPTKVYSVPGFASGGTFGGGLRLVGENGPELEMTGPSRIFNASQTRDLLGGGSGGAEMLRQELMALRRELAGLRDQVDDLNASASRGTFVLERSFAPEGDAFLIRGTS